MADAITGLVRILHIFTAIMWVGGASLWTMVVAPRILRDGPPAIRRPFAEAAIPAVTRYFKIMATIALLSGLLLIGMIWGWGNYFDAFQGPSGGGTALTIGALSGITMAIIGFGIVAPTAKKMLATMQTINGPPTPAQQEQLAGMGKKIGKMGMLTIVFGSLAILGMVWSVNVFRG